MDLLRQESLTLREENRKLSTESIRLKTMLQLEKDRKVVVVMVNYIPLLPHIVYFSR